MKHTQFKGDWRKVFGEKYQVPQEIEDKFLDQSHDNSLCPSFLIGHKGDEEITLWVEHPDFNERVTDVNGRMMSKEVCQPSRFLFMALDAITMECRTLLETDNEELAIRHAKAMREYLNRGRIPGTKAQPVCPMCANRDMASMGMDIICSECHTKCGEVA